MKKLILAAAIAIAILIGFNAAETKASVLSTEVSSLQESNDSYVYVKVVVDGRVITYIYTTDGLFVGVLEEAN